MKSRSFTVRALSLFSASSPSRRSVCRKPEYDQKVTLWAWNLSKRSFMGLYSLKVSTPDRLVHPSCHWEGTGQNSTGEDPCPPISAGIYSVSYQVFAEIYKALDSLAPCFLPDSTPTPRSQTPCQHLTSATSGPLRL